MSYIKDGTIYPYNPRSLKRDFPNVSFPRPIPDSVLADYGVYPVADTAQPAYDEATQNIAEGFPVDAGGNNWSQTWDVTAKTAQEQADYAEDLAETAARQAIKNDTPVKTLLLASGNQINTYIDNNVNNLAEAKALLKILARAVSVVARGTLR